MFAILALVCLLPLCSGETWHAPINFDNLCRRETVCFLGCPFGRAVDERGCELCACRMPDFGEMLPMGQPGGQVPDFVPNLVPANAFDNAPFLLPPPETVPMLEPIPQLIPASPQLIPVEEPAPALIPALEPVPQLQPAPQLIPARRSIPSRFLKTGQKA